MSDVVRAARDELLRVGLHGEVPEGATVPDLVVRSWRRSISSSVESSALVSRFQDVDADSLLYRAAAPVLDKWQTQLADTRTTLFLSDRAGSIVARRASDSSVRRRLDRVHAAEGFDYSEESAGTNGLGTSMVEKQAILIEGSQHYNDALAGLACAAAPVCAPAGSVLGAVSLGGPLESTSPLMLSLTREISQQIEERLRASSRPQDLALAMSFMRYTNSRRPTLVIDGESLLANNAGLPYVDVTSHVLLWQQLEGHDWSRSGTTRLALQDRSVEVVARRVADGPRVHYVVHLAESGHDAATAGRGETVGVAVPADLPAGGPSGVLAVTGPPGSGRATLARELHRSRGERPLVEVVADAQHADVAVSRLLAEDQDVLLRRVEDLADDAVPALGRVVAAHLRARREGARRTTLLVTDSAVAASSPARQALAHLLGVSHGAEHRTTALSDAPDRIPGLVKQVLDEADPHGRRTLSPAALQAFVQWSWPGNLRELTETVDGIVAGATTAVIERRHLPDHLRQAPPRRTLSLMESAEREAILRALGATDGNKSEAAALLGIGRTTLYRRLRQLGLDNDETSL